MIQRRSFLCGSLAGAVLGASSEAVAENGCNQFGCTAQVSFSKFVAKYEPQYQSEWCWAACISMLFNYYNHPVRQDRIVTEAYGVPANIPAGSGFLVAAALNKSWEDDNGDSFDASLEAAFDAQAGVAAIDNSIIIQALANGDPLIVGARGHVTVVTAVSYIPTPLGPNVMAVGVFDPWPGQGARNLAIDEMTPMPMGGSLMFLALAKVV
jgi:hypothetical protein